ncbi:peptidoglycan recognition protein [Streptomyces coelicoflavus]|uniref:peptidoglycan recognition protein family protein n=1 Tax=Streptomyces coelicoflavus TaxID=285562 RepID=UPI002E25CA17|nr:N-acetylmuramoyl-L-alanine amidase [Streptomyces coelicoflavus]
MRGFLASSTGVTCAAALALPLAPPAAATTSAAPPVASSTARPEAYAPGGTQSLPLTSRTRDRAPGAAEQGLARRDVRHFSLVGVVWDNPATELHGRVEVRTRATATGAWSGWRELETHNADHAADPGTPESTSGRVRGATAPLWVGESDGVEVRVRAETAPGSARTAPAASPLPTGLRLELVDPGRAAPPPTNRARTKATEPAVLPALPALQKTKPHAGPRPRITTRRGWGADEKLREKGFVYTKKVKAAFVHHSDTGNNYRCSQAPSVIRGIYRYHVNSMGWRDLGYNFLVDKCGNVYEGRAGGVSKPVLGAHTLGFNSNSVGIAVLGTYSSKKPSSAALKAIARLAAWKVGLYGMNPRGKTYLKSGGGNLYPKGKKVRLNVISGHRDGFATNCPGKKLYAKLGTARAKAAAYQGR